MEKLSANIMSGKTKRSDIFIGRRKQFLTGLLREMLDYLLYSSRMMQIGSTHPHWVMLILGVFIVKD
jgi:hypothetical protein